MLPIKTPMVCELPAVVAVVALLRFAIVLPEILMVAEPEGILIPLMKRVAAAVLVD